MQSKECKMPNDKKHFQLLYISDIVGDPGFEILLSCIKDIKNDNRITLTVANGENGTSGKGLTQKTVNEYFDIGIDIITSGNHIWNREKFYSVLDEDNRILRPANYPSGCPGRGSTITEVYPGIKAGIINLQGRAFMYPIDCPFRAANTEIQRMEEEGVRIIIIDFHAEATAEKMALGWYVDGRVSAIIGSHTHVQTADERILPGGTAYITDAGMTGPFDSVIGMDKEVAIKRFYTQLPVHYKIATENLKCCGVIITIDPESGKAQSISRFQISS